MIPWHRFVEVIRSHHRFVLTTHVRPDGDALGCELAMFEVLAVLGKDVRVCNGFAVPPNLRSLDPQRRLGQLGVDIAADELGDREVFIILDTTAWAQLGLMAEVIRGSRAVKLVVDHHVSGDDLGAELFKDAEAEAAGRLVVEAADALGVLLSPAIARPAFVALATDTGWFRFSSTTADTLRLAARLADAGAVPDQLYKQLYENESPGRLRLIGRALSHIEIELGGRLVHTWIGQSDFRETGAVPSDSEDIINLTLSIGGTEVAIILVEQPKGGFKVSLRSRCAVDCSTIAERFAGGGHRRAAGASLDGPLEAAREKILDVVRAAMVNGEP